MECENKAYDNEQLVMLNIPEQSLQLMNKFTKYYEEIHRLSLWW